MMQINQNSPPLTIVSVKHLSILRPNMSSEKLVTFDFLSAIVTECYTALEFTPDPVFSK